jgi:signal transduction histidine kinase
VSLDRNRRVLAVGGIYTVVVVALIASSELAAPSRLFEIGRLGLAAAGLVAVCLVAAAGGRRDGRDAPTVHIPDDGPVAGVEPPAPEEGEMRDELEKLDRALDVGVVVTDEKGQPKLVGERARELLGLSPSQLPDGGGSSAFSELSHAASEVAESGEVRETLLETPGADSPSRVEATVYPPGDDESGEVVVQLRDRENVAALRRTVMDAARLRGLSRLYLGVAHDLRAPINAINLNLVNLRHFLAEAEDLQDRVEQLETVEMLQDELRRLQRAVESVLGQTAPIGTDTTVFDVRELIEELRFLFQAQARQQRIHLEIDLPRQTTLIEASRDALKQAILNVVVNAFDAAPDNGTVAIAVSCDQRWVRVSVTDDGPGILDAVRQRLFEMHMTTKESGSGIGLFVANSVVEECGGSLAVAETGPGGTVFVIELPTAKGGEIGSAT